MLAANLLLKYFSLLRVKADATVLNAQRSDEREKEL